MSNDDDNDDRPRKEESSNGMIIGIVVVVILLLIGGGYYYYKNYYSNCEKTKCTPEILMKDNITSFKVDDKLNYRFYNKDKCVCQCNDIKSCINADTALKLNNILKKPANKFPCTVYNKYRNRYEIGTFDQNGETRIIDPVAEKELYNKTPKCSFDN